MNGKRSPPSPTRAVRLVAGIRARLQGSNPREPLSDATVSEILKELAELEESLSELETHSPLRSLIVAELVRETLAWLVKALGSTCNWLQTFIKRSRTYADARGGHQEASDGWWPLTATTRGEAGNRPHVSLSY